MVFGQLKGDLRSLLPPEERLCTTADCTHQLANLEPSWVDLDFNPRIDWHHGGVRGDCVVGELEYIKDKYCRPEGAPSTPHNWPSEARLRHADVHSKHLAQSALSEISTLLINRTVIVMGDSVMEQFYNALECRLSREQLELLSVEDRVRLRSYLEKTHPLWQKGKRHMAPKSPHVMRTDGGPSKRGVEDLLDWGGKRRPPAWLLFERAVKFELEDVQAALKVADVIIVNWGLHYHDMLDYRKDLHQAMALFEAFVKAKPRRAVLFRETAAQHFKGHGHGEYELRDTASVESADGERSQCSCAPMEDYNVNRQNGVLREVLASRKYPHVQRLPFYALTRPRWRWHFGNCTARPNGWGGEQCCDCTHYCYSPNMWGAHLHDLKRTLSRSRLCAAGCHE